MIVDTEQKGLGLIFKPYQIEVIKLLLKEKEVKSQRAWKHLQGLKIDTKSRASVINFLEKLTRDGLVSKREETGKGGHHGIYAPTFKSENELWQLIIAHTMKILSRESGIKLTLV